MFDHSLSDEKDVKCTREGQGLERTEIVGAMNAKVIFGRYPNCTAGQCHNNCNRSTDLKSRGAPIPVGARPTDNRLADLRASVGGVPIVEVRVVGVELLRVAEVDLEGHVVVGVDGEGHRAARRRVAVLREGVDGRGRAALQNIRPQEQ